MAGALTRERLQEGNQRVCREDREAIALADPAARLAPVLEGARARGVADAFAMAGQAAILLGGAGEVLHAGPRAKALLGAGLRLCDGRLLALDEGNQGLERQLGHAHEGEPALRPHGITLAAAGGGSMRVRMLPFTGGASNPTQLLKAVLLLDPLA